MLANFSRQTLLFNLSMKEKEIKKTKKSLNLFLIICFEKQLVDIIRQQPVGKTPTTIRLDQL